MRKGSRRLLANRMFGIAGTGCGACKAARQELQTAREARAVPVMQRSGVASAVLAAVITGGIVSAVLGMAGTVLATVVAGTVVSAVLGVARAMLAAVIAGGIVSAVLGGAHG